MIIVVVFWDILKGLFDLLYLTSSNILIHVAILSIRND